MAQEQKLTLTFGSLVIKTDVKEENPAGILPVPQQLCPQVKETGGDAQGAITRKKGGTASLSDTGKSDVVQSKEIKAMREITLQNCSGSVPGKKDLNQIMMITKISKSELAINKVRLEINRGFLITGIVWEELSVRGHSGAEPQLLAIKMLCIGLAIFTSKILLQLCPVGLTVKLQFRFDYFPSCSEESI